MNHDTIRQLCEDIAESHVDINGFYHGDYDEILGAERNNISYPLLWFETPYIPVQGDEDGLIFSYRSAFTILVNSPKDDIPRTRFNRIWTERIAKELIMKLTCQDSFKFSDIEMEPLANINNDNDHGWRVAFSITPYTNSIPIKDKFYDKLPFNTRASFSWTVDESDGQYQFSINNTVLPSLSDFEYKFSVMKGAGTALEELPPGGNPTFTSSSPEVFIQLVLSKNGVSRRASGFTLNASPGSSFELIYNPFA